MKKPGFIYHSIFILIGILFSFSISGQNAVTDSIKTEVNKAKNSEELASLYRSLFEAYKSTNADSALKYGKMSLANLLETAQYNDFFALSCAMGSYTLSQNRQKEAIAFYEAAIQEIEHLDNKKSALCAYMMLGYLYDISESLYEAHVAYYTGLRIAEDLHDSTWLWSYYNNLGSHYLALDDGQNALMMLKKALKIYLALKEEESKYNPASTFNNIGTAYLELKVYDSAFYYFDAALNMPGMENNYYGIFTIQSNLATIALENHNNTLALTHMQQVSVAFDSLLVHFNGSKTHMKAMYYDLWGKYYLSTGEYQQAKKYSLLAITEAKKINELKIISKSYKRLSEIFRKENEFQSALQYLTKYLHASDSLNDILNNRQITKETLSFKYEQELASQKLNLELEMEKNRTREAIYLFLLFSGLGIAITILLLYLLQVSKGKRKAAQQEAIRLEKEMVAENLKYKQKEIATNVLFLSQKNELILNTSKRLTQLAKEADHAVASELKLILKDLNKNVASDSWKDFELRFKEVHSDFYNKLTENYPNLTSSEYRLCAFLRLNMTSKEIAGFTFQTPESLKIARYRLRKKLGIDRDENLVSFLMKL